MTYESINTKFLSLSTREKALILLAMAGVILFAGYALVIEPELEKNQRVAQRMEQQRSDIVGLEDSIKQLEVELLDDPNKPLEAQREQLQTSLDALDVQLKNQTFDLIPPNEMSRVLDQVLSKVTSLKLVELSSIAPKTVVRTATQGGEQINLYQHGVRIVLEGRFFDVQAYLEDIESLEWQFYWRMFDYNVTEYPLARVEIDLYTLSTSDAFIGV